MWVLSEKSLGTKCHSPVDKNDGLKMYLNMIAHMHFKQKMYPKCFKNLFWPVEKSCFGLIHQKFPAHPQESPDE